MKGNSLKGVEGKRVDYARLLSLNFHRNSLKGVEGQARQCLKLLGQAGSRNSLKGVEGGKTEAVAYDIWDSAKKLPKGSRRFPQAAQGSPTVGSFYRNSLKGVEGVIQDTLQADLPQVRNFLKGVEGFRRRVECTRCSVGRETP